MENFDVRAIELLMDNMGQGVVYVDRDRRIQTCSQRAKEITGIVIDAKASHESGKLAEGDIVIIADNKLGEDDGNLGTDELALLNIHDREIQLGDMLVAVGVYGNKRIEPQYKHLRGQQPGLSLKLDVNYFGFHITASIDQERAETVIQVGTKVFRLGYYYCVGNMVVIDGATGGIKFFQAKGYSVRNEDAGNLMRGQRWLAKNTEDSGIDVEGKRFLELFDESALSQRLFDVLDGAAEQVSNRLYEINKRPLICDIVPWPSKMEPDGAFLIIRGAQNLDHLLSDRNEIIRQIEERNQGTRSQTAAYPENAFSDFAGKSRKTQEVKYLAWKAANSRFNVILTGESGTGKSKLARAIHNAGEGSQNSPFVEVNCNAIAPTLFESELFGYVGGAFTGAKSDGHVGYFEAADKGTIFLDEIGEIPLEIQVKLLHVLQNKIIYRVGSSKPVKVDVRVIAATNKNLEEEVAMGRFRQDLFYRINVFPIDIPPLRERKADLYVLINQLLKTICDNYGLEQKQFSGEAIQKMVAYDWPGNVRELENAIERAITLCDSNIIYSEHLRIGKGAVPTTMKEMLAKEEERILEMTLIKYNGDKQKAMTELDLSRTVFYDKLKKYKIRY